MDKQVSDFKEATLVFVKQLLNLKQSEKLLVYLDQGSDYSLAEIIRESAQQIGASAEIFQLASGLKLQDMERELIHKIETGSFDAICELSEQSFYPTLVWEKALKLGSRIYTLASMDAAGFIRCVEKADHDSMFQLGMKLKEILSEATTVQIISNKGTDIRFKMKANLASRVMLKLMRRQGSCIWEPSGILRGNIRYSFVGGQLAFMGIPETIEGIAVIDGYLSPPKEIGRLDTPITLKIKKGRVIEIGGCPLKSKILNQWLENKSKAIQHFCIGFNPGAEFLGRLMEAERVFGCINMGFGNYPFHVDGVIKSPSILLDGEFIEKDGSFINQELSILERKLIGK